MGGRLALLGEETSTKPPPPRLRREAVEPAKVIPESTEGWTAFVRPGRKLGRDLSDEGTESVDGGEDALVGPNLVESVCVPRPLAEDNLKLLRGENRLLIG